MMPAIFIILGALHWPALAGQKIEVQGHRGARWVRPENTLPAFQYALEIGADTLEMDMHVTKNNIVVITHDPYLNPDICVDKLGHHLTQKVLVRSLTFKELEQYDCGSLINPRFPQQKVYPNTPIPSLEEVFVAIEKSGRARKIQYNIETKSEEAHPEYTPAPDEFVKQFLAVVKKHKLLERVVLQSFDYRTLRIAHQLEPKLKLSVLIEDKPKKPGELVSLMKELKGQILSPNHEWLSKNDVAEMHKMNVRVIPWTPDQKSDWQRLIAIGVDGIITDNPKELIDYLTHP